MKHSCGNAECPECWGDWAQKSSRKATERLRGYIRTARPETGWFDEKEEEKPFVYFDPAWYDLAEDDDSGFEPFWRSSHADNAQQVRHWILSAAPGELTPDMPTLYIHEIGKFWARWVGIRGGMMVFHPWRIMPAVQQKMREIIKRGRMNEEEYEKKFWNSIRDKKFRQDILGYPTWQECVYWSPHFHIIGFGYTCDAPQFLKLTGWLLKFVRNVSQKQTWTGQKMKDDIAALAYYLLSHCNVEWGRKSVIWIGCMTPTNLRKLQEKPKVNLYPKECEECKAQQVVYLLGKTDDELGDVSVGQDGQPQYLFHKEKLYFYCIITEKMKHERRERRRAERAAKRACQSAPPGPALPSAIECGQG